MFLVNNDTKKFNLNFKADYKKNTAPKKEYKQIESLPNYSSNCALIQFGKSCDEKKYSDFKTRQSKVTKEEFEQIKRNSPSILFQAYKTIDENKYNKFDVMPDTIARCALGLKNFLDFDTKDNYTLLSIGASPDMLSGAMKELGCDVVFCPASNVSEVLGEDENCEYIIQRYPNFKIILDYLNSKGINAKNYNDTDRKIVLFDYYSSGKTLRIFEKLLKEYMGINPENIVKYDIIDTLDIANAYNQYKNKEDLLSPQEKYAIMNDLSMQMTLSNTPHFSVIDNERNKKEGYINPLNKSCEEIFYEFENHSEPLARAYSLCVLNELDKMNKL